jgi:hypothetical protein
MATGFSFAVLIPQQLVLRSCFFRQFGSVLLALPKHRFLCWNDKMAVLCYVEEKTMPEFTTVSIQEAQLRTIPGRQGQFINQYADYIQQLPQGRAGRLRVEEQEKPMTIRRRLAVASQALGIPLIIKRSGNDLYFWREDGGEGRPRRGRRPRNGSPGSLVPPMTGFSAPETGTQGEESTPMDQAFVEVE